MVNENFISTDNIEVSSGNAEDLRPGGSLWTSAEDDEDLTATITIVKDGEMPIDVGDFMVKNPSTSNIKRFYLYIQGPDDDEPIPYNPSNPTADAPEVLFKNLPFQCFFIVYANMKVL